jgi:hypothetical protein
VSDLLRVLLGIDPHTLLAMLLALLGLRVALAPSSRAALERAWWF